MNDSTPHDQTRQAPTSPGSSPLDDDRLDGFTVERLSDYLDHGREPRDAAIEGSSSAQNALAALSRLRAVAPRVLVRDADEFAPRNDNWISRILDQIGVQAHAGRDIPIAHDVAGAVLSISEGAVRAIVREVGDGIEGLVVERCRLEGDVETVDAPTVVVVDVSAFSGIDLHATIDDFRQRVYDALGLHTDLHVSEVSVRVRDTDLEEKDGRAR